MSFIHFPAPEKRYELRDSSAGRLNPPTKRPHPEADNVRNSYEPRRPDARDRYRGDRRNQQRRESGSWIPKAIGWILGYGSPPPEIEDAIQEHDEEELADVLRENDALNAKVQDLLRQLQHRRHIVFEQDDAAVEARNNRIKNLQSTVDRMKIEHTAEVQRVISEADAKAARDMKELRNTANQQILAAKRAASDLRDQSQGAQKTCRKLEAQIEQQLETIRGMQAARMKSVESTQWAPIANSEIQSELKSIVARVRQWAIECSALFRDQGLDSKGFARLVCASIDKGCAANAFSLHGHLAQNKSTSKPGKAAAMLLAAVASFEIMHKIIGNPFFIFAGQLDEDMLHETEAKSMANLIELTGHGDEAGGEGLRYQLLRLLDPSQKDTSYGTKYLRGVVDRSRKKAVSQLAAGLLDQLLGEITADDLANARSGLEAVVNEAAELSWKLWTRKGRMEVFDQARLAKETKGVDVYSGTSALLEAHSLHVRDLENDSGALEGKPIILVCSPVVAIAGDAEGQGYTKSRVLKKAVVWMG
ncbi:hypothetical protein CB0940_05459 [Cercospora beticola]|uniref:Uncharacterized protein n=1 Tax=Cercospora beticola TaxID=122368 RepID=A0A2G5HYB4_CERBT|nr:hypothetical protein CB0940_05459 [Cercospora beticola]PIA97518.1 hypothetical protein CB0940_05459 [Cercospora beticola]WPA98007.1 hypothetical protein RHO25_002618 [Cercospora beticola]CAK1359213.1 unnamed protein product [Cercospora beticola]